MIMTSTGLNEDRSAYTDCLPRQNIAPGISDHPRTAEIKAYLVCGLQKHARLGLATIALILRLMRTKVDPVHPSAVFPNQFNQSLIEFVSGLQGEHPSPYGRLVRYDDDFVTGILYTYQ